MKGRGFKRHYSRTSRGAMHPRKAGGNPLFIRTGRLQNQDCETVPKNEIEALKRMAKTLEAGLSSFRLRLGQMDQKHTTFHFMAQVDAKKCVGCGICMDNCPTGAIGLEQFARVDPKHCSGCGRCIVTCPQGAISLRPAELLTNRIVTA